MKAHSLLGRICTACSTRQLDDPVFGHMRRRGGCWETDTLLPDQPEPVLVDVFSPDAGPSQAQRAMFAHLREHFCQLKSSMQEPLFDKYRRVREMFHAHYLGKPFEPEFDADFPRVKDAGDIWSIVHLRRIDLYGRGDHEVVFDHIVQWENDHHLDVALRDWQVVDVAMDSRDG